MHRTEQAARIESLKAAYRLEPHPEGGAFAEAWSSTEAREGRPLAGSIYFLLERDEISHLHVIDCDEVWYFHEGCGMVLTMIAPDGTVSEARLGTDTGAGERMMIAIPAGVLFAARNLDPEGYTFVSCATSPHFTYEGFRLIGEAELKRLCADRADELLTLIVPEKRIS